MAESTFDEGDKMRRWKRILADPRPALKTIGSIMVGESQQAFQDQKFGQDVWPQRGPINVFGIIADFHADIKKPPARRFERTPALIDKGFAGGLLGSIAFNLKGKDAVEVGSNKDYAPVHMTGGPVKSKPINQQVRDLLAKFLKENPQWREDLGWIFSKKDGEEIKGNVPARPFVGITKQTRKDIRDELERMLEAD